MRNFGSKENDKDFRPVLRLPATIGARMETFLKETSKRKILQNLHCQPALHVTKTVDYRFTDEENMWGEKNPQSVQTPYKNIPPDHRLLDSAPNLGPLISCWEHFNTFENCWYKGVRILEVLKLLFQQFLNLSSSQRDMSGPILADRSNNRWSGVTPQNTDEALCNCLWMPSRRSTLYLMEDWDCCFRKLYYQQNNRKWKK